MQIAVLGAGMVGKTIALDLARSHSVHSYDVNATHLDALQKANASISTSVTDLTDFNNYRNFLQKAELVVLALPGHIGYKALEAVINCGKNAADISFFPENALDLDSLAREKGVTVITDCGVAPGMSNFILGRYNEEMEIDSFACYVGGLPKDRSSAFQYKAPFSPVDVIQEYIRPARLIEDGDIVTKPAMSDRELLSFDPVGELEAFNTDGLRSLVYTMGHIPELKEKTLRYPGHLDIIIALEKAGFFSEDEKCNGISPLSFTSQLLINEWKLLPGEPEFTIMKIIIKGKKNGKRKEVYYDLYDENDMLTGFSSMARTTGFTCNAAVELIVREKFFEHGVFPPELVGRNRDCFDFVLSYLKERNVNWKRTGTED